MVILNDVVPELAIGPVAKDGAEKLRRVDPEAQGSDNNNQIVPGWNG